MADTKISALTAKAVPVAADVAVIVDSVGGANKKVELGNLPVSTGVETRLGGAGAPDATEISYVNGVTSAIQTQLDSKLNAAMTIAPADGVFDGPSFTGVAGENLAFGEVCYPWFDSNVRKFKKGIGTATTTAPVIAICVNPGGITSGNSGLFSYCCHVTNTAWNWGTTASGLLTQLFLSVSSAGALQQTVPATSGQLIQNVADVISADTIFFRPSRDIGEVL